MDLSAGALFTAGGLALFLLPFMLNKMLIQAWRDRVLRRRFAASLGIETTAGVAVDLGRFDRLEVAFRGRAGDLRIDLRSHGMIEDCVLSVVCGPQPALSMSLEMTGDLELRGALDEEVERLLLGLARDPRVASLRVAEGRLECELRRLAADGSERELLQSVSKLSMALSMNVEQRAKRLLRLIRSATDAEIRLKAFVTIVMSGLQGAHREAVALARSAPEPAMRIAAGLSSLDPDLVEEAGEAGGFDHPLLLANAEVLTRYVGPRATQRRMGLLLLRRPETAYVAVGATLVDRACRAGDDEVEAALLAASRVHEDVPEAVLGALRDLGSLRSVSRLRALLDGPSPRDGFHEQVRSALRGVQSRLEGAEDGGLRLVAAAPDEGAIRVAAETGAIRAAGQRGKLPQ